MKTSSSWGFAPLALILLLAAAAVIVGWLPSPHIPGLPTPPSAPALAVQANQAAQEANTKAAAAAQITEAKDGQQYTAAAAVALAQSPATDPGAEAAKTLLPKADAALAGGLGSLSPAQAAWVQTYVANATAADQVHQATAAAALAAKDAQLNATAAQVQTLNAEKTDLETQRKILDQTLTEHDAKAGALWFWLKVGVLGYLFARFGLPLLAKMFPALAVFETAAHTLLDPLAAKALAEARDLAQNASGAVSAVLSHVEATAPAVLAGAKAEAGKWLTEADGTAEKFRANLAALKLT